MLAARHAPREGKRDHSIDATGGVRKYPVVLSDKSHSAVRFAPTARECALRDQPMDIAGISVAAGLLFALLSGIRSFCGG